MGVDREVQSFPVNSALILGEPFRDFTSSLPDGEVLDILHRRRGQSPKHPRQVSMSLIVPVSCVYMSHRG
ncbi:hypothetical protein chiPu_0020017 [Chiloscyllium punctatum]|uniref:Uncharacterized protein n=1 Tax=Chiloscyllium punctatum TaxID=137246 RepID=A0A401RTR9_CHIPU|nr:hypothetical protein [Chiloscyllium punctatum]